MKRMDIDDAAKRFGIEAAEKREHTHTPDLEALVFNEKDIEDAFIKGTQWAMNVRWHRLEDKIYPKKDGAYLCRTLFNGEKRLSACTFDRSRRVFKSDGGAVLAWAELPEEE